LSRFFFEKSCSNLVNQRGFIEPKRFRIYFRKLTCQLKIVSICSKSVFVFSVRNINIFGRILTQFTGLLRTNTVAAKRDLWTECTGLGISVSVSLRKNAPKALSNGAIPKLNFQVSGRISVVMSTFPVFGLSYGRSNNVFCVEEGQNPIFDPLPRNEKLCSNLYNKFALRNGLPIS